MSAQYTLAQATDPEAERRRLSLLQRCYDPWTVADLESCGIAGGWTCIDAGAGAGSIARWLADRVGPAGSVVAIDLDLTLLEPLAAPSLSLRRIDVRNDDLPAGADLVHARFLLEHLPEFRTAFDRMVRALRPGGWLVVTDADFTSIALDVADPAFARAASAFLSATRTAGWDPAFGASLPSLFEDAGLDGIVATSRQVREHGGDHAALLAASYGRIATLIQHHGATADDVERARTLMEDPAFFFSGPTIWTVRGRAGGSSRSRLTAVSS